MKWLVWLSRSAPTKALALTVLTSGSYEREQRIAEGAFYIC